MSQKVELGKLVITIEEQDEKAIYKFSGEVDEHFVHQNVPRIKKDLITFDLEELSNFNSCGIREWIYLIRDIENQGSLQFHNCSVPMIDNINMVPDSVGKAKIHSFYAPYYCSCSGEVNRLIDTTQESTALSQKSAPIFTCEKCNNDLEFDALEESYFLFMDNHAALSKEAS